MHNAATQTTPSEGSRLTSSHHWIERGTPAFRRTCFSLLLGGFSSFALLYCVQPILPVLAQHFGVTPAQSSLTLSVATLSLAAGLLVTGPLSDVLGRKPIMVIALLLASLLTLASALCDDWHMLLLLRAGIGLALSGITAVAVTYLGEEVHRHHVGYALGIYIGGSAIGGMCGRLLSGVLVDYLSWHWVIGIMGTLVLAGAVTFWRILPASRHFKPSSITARRFFNGYIAHLANPLLRVLYVAGFLLMGSFVAFFNYIGFHLSEARLGFSQAAIGLVSCVYLVGTFSSAKVGALADRRGHRRVFGLVVLVTLAGILLTCITWSPLVITGTVVFTFGFFGSHAVASSWIGKVVQHNKAQATSLYQISFYLGASVSGTVGGIFWSTFSWGGVVVFIALMLTACVSLSAQAATLQKQLRCPVNRR